MIEKSHGKARLTRPRLSAVATVPTDGDRRRRDHDESGRFRPGNRASAGRGATRAIERPEAALAAIAAKTPGGPCEPAELEQMLRDVRALYRETRRDLASASPLVLAPAATFARETVLAGYLTAKAFGAGPSTETGIALLDAAHRAEARAERAAVQALTLAQQLAAAAPMAADVPWLRPSDDGGAG